MSETPKDRRKIGRRRKARRMYDLLQGKATDEERDQYDRLLWSRYLDADRRAKDRRSDQDRREDDET